MKKPRLVKLDSTDSFHCITRGPWRTRQTEKAEEDLHALLPNNPFVPPKGDICFIKNLPPELLSRIFEVGSADSDSEDGDEEETDAIRSSDFPPPWPSFQIVASHVCRRWRNVALSTPSLWTIIKVAPEAHPPYESVSTRLERSKGLPIDIYVNYETRSSDDETPSDTDFQFLFSLLFPHIHRWQTMTVSTSKYQPVYAIPNAVFDSSMPAALQLTALDVDRPGHNYPRISQQPTLVGGSAPLLTRLVLCGVHVDWNQPWIASASNLTDLELAFHPTDVRPSWAQFASILRGASALEKLSLCMSGPSGDPHDWFIEPTPGSPADLNAPVQLPHVTDFIFAVNDSQARAIGLLRKLYLPALKNLVLDLDNCDYTEFVHELARPVTSLSLPSAKEQPHSLLRNLETLRLAGLPCRTDCVETLYGELQNLTSLNIALLWLPEEFLSILGSPDIGRHEMWLPRLVTLYVSNTETSTVVLREIVQQRKDAGVPLNSLYVLEAYGVHSDEDVEWLKENLKTFELLDGSDEEDPMIDFGHMMPPDVDGWSGMSDMSSDMD